MKAAWLEAERIAEVRGAARDWKKAGAIDEAALAAIEAEYPSTRTEIARAWKVVVFVLVSVAVMGIQYGAFGFGGGGSGRFFLFGSILAVVTEALRGSKLAGTGSDAATSCWAVVNLIVAVGLLANFNEMTGTLAVAAAAFAAASWRWGFALYAAFSAGAAFLLLARFPASRLTWAVGGALLAAASVRLAERRRFSPSRRRAFAAVFVAGSVALYGAVNLYSFDRRSIEGLGRFLSQRAFASPSPALRPPLAVATAALPLLFLLWGLWKRRRLVLDTGALLAALSILTFHYYFRFGSIPITLFGLALIAIALGLNRLLARAAGEELRGFTVSRLLAPESEAVSPAAALFAATATPVSPPQEQDPFAPGGGQYGGGGASGTY
jgi:hypothetical protein